MNYKRIWDEGYGKRRAKIMACASPHSRKTAVCQQVWARMVMGLKQKAQGSPA